MVHHDTIRRCFLVLTPPWLYDLSLWMSVACTRVEGQLSAQVQHGENRSHGRPSMNLSGKEW